MSAQPRALADRTFSFAMDVRRFVNRLGTEAMELKLIFAAIAAKDDTSK
jgi:hypothetical protein